jgi:hypothetical protein
MIPHIHTTRTTVKMTGQYSMKEIFISDRWETIMPREKDDLLARIKGAAYWVEFTEPNRLCYHVKDGAGNEYAVKFIND